MNALENRFIWDPSAEQLPVYFVGNNYGQDAMRDMLLSPGLPFQRFLFHGILSHALQESFGLPDFHRPSGGAAARSCSLAGDLLAKRECCLARARSEEHTSELQSLAYLVCRLLLEKKKKNNI